MTSSLSPFDVLGISPDAELEVVAAAYKALARKYHPDMNFGVPAEELTKKMATLNWAKDELERDLAGWRSRVATAGKASYAGTARGATASQDHRSRGPVTIEPQVVSLPGSKGAVGNFTVSAPGLEPTEIKARFQAGTIDVERRASFAGGVLFAVTVVEDFPSDVSGSLVEAVEIVISGVPVGKAFISLAPLSAAVLGQHYGGRVAPTKHVSDEARISFGKHRGATFYTIAVQEPSYLQWMLQQGAGSVIERQSAQMALTRVNSSFQLPAKRSSRRKTLKASRPTVSSVPALPDPTKPRGLWGAIKALVSGK